jgi:hypothetical protein
VAMYLEHIPIGRCVENAVVVVVETDDGAWVRQARWRSGLDAARKAWWNRINGDVLKCLLISSSSANLKWIVRTSVSTI